jgi:hypothetical protein
VRSESEDSDDSSSESEVENDDKPCGRCGKYDHPEWVRFFFAFIFIIIFIIIINCLQKYYRFYYATNVMMAFTPHVFVRLLC